MPLVSGAGRTSAAAFSRDHPLLVGLGRAGWFVKGLVYLLAGGLALIVVGRSYGSKLVNGPTEEASPTGAIKEVASLAGGRLLLVVLAVGLVFYAAWRVVTAVLPGSMSAEALAMRIGYLVSAVIYATFSFTAVSLARRPTQNADGNQKVTDISGRLLGSTAGRFVLGAAGAIAIGAGLYRTVKGLRGDVTNELNLAGMSTARRTLTKRLGMIGEIGRGIAIGLIGFFLLRAAIHVNAQEATGLDGALHRLTSDTWGRVVVAIIAVGFFLYGILCIETFNRRTLQAP